MRKFATSILLGSLVATSIPSWTQAQTASITYVKRSEAAMLLLKNAGVEVDTNIQSKGQYPDIVDGNWYVPHVLKAIEFGILEVAETGFVYPHRSVSRADFLKMMTKAFGLSTDLSYQYTDIDSDSEVARYAGLSWRYSLFDSLDGKLYPDLRISHLEAAKAVFTLLEAEPSLQPEGGLLPSKAVPTKVVTVKPKLVPLHSAASNEEGSASSKSTGIFLSLSTPTSIKNATMKLLTSRESLASITRNDLIAAVNTFRAQYNLGPLRSNYYLELSGQKHAKDMADRGYFSHYTPEGFSYVDRIRASGYLNSNACSCIQQFDHTQTEKQGPNYLISNNQQCSCEPAFSLGENLAKGQLTVKQVMEDWKNSPSHRENMLRPEFNEIGIGLYEDIWVQQFGKLTFR